MTDPDQQPHDEHLHQFVHDINQCLYIIGMATEVLKGVQDDKSQMAEVCELIDKERRTAVELLAEFLRGPPPADRPGTVIEESPLHET